MDKKINKIYNRLSDQITIDMFNDLINDINNLQLKNMLLERFLVWYITEKFDKQELYNDKPMLLHFFNTYILNNFRSVIQISKKEHFEKLRVNLYEYIVINEIKTDLDIDDFVGDVKNKITLIINDLINEL
ncbi:MAG: hypothetical protein CBD98_002195 [Flavobacteriaceae bacterium TMED238]|mgnify:FL=1|nr:MAG: hypothetical protein CBD98_002195 [Flavobacteriaceae bacterium TMED238]BAR33816.1 hypothetical protein [uncultured Mediterranean phage uvMED]|tara:strand:- start:8811 stop:9203 length:393 start_codon:yes stop_codon:yes gene_type:complete